MRLRYQVALLAVVVLGLYYPALHAPLNSVDDPGMYRYLLNTDAFPLKDLFFPAAAPGYYRPLLILSFVMDKYLWGLQESFMHLDNILLHLGNSLLLLAVGRRICRLGGWPSRGAFIAALLFAIHPLNTESVCWISGRPDPLTGSFLLLSLWALLWRERPLLASTLSAFFLLLACLVKETAIFYLPAALLFPLFLPADQRDELFPSRLCHFLSHLSCALLYFSLRTHAFSRADEGIAQVTAAAKVSAAPQAAAASAAALHPQGVLLPELLAALKTVGFYARKLVAPLPLNFGLSPLPEWYLLLGAAFALLLAYLVLARRGLLSFCWLAFASLASSALLVQYLKVTWTPVAERYMYLPSAFFLVGVTLSVQGSALLASHRKALTGVLVLVVAVGAYATLSRSLLWQDNLAFFQDTVRKSPGFQPARNELAVALKERGREREASEIFKSFRLDRSLKNYQFGLLSKAGALMDERDYQGARSTLQLVLDDPGRHEVAALEEMVKLDRLESERSGGRDEQWYRDAVGRLNRLYQLTGDPFYRYRLAVLHLHHKRRIEAATALEDVCKAAPRQAYYLKPAEKLLARLQLDAATGREGKVKP